MPLILAIEPDRRQASQLKRLTRGCAADLVLADTTERALEAIGNRVPDLVLVPALLSPQDDVALATALRVIAAAAHVQTLTIPVFAPPAAPTGGGVLAKWRRGRATAASQGCDPALFAEQIAAYLAEAAAAREALAPIAEKTAPVADVVKEPARYIQPATPVEPAPVQAAQSEAQWEPVVFQTEPIDVFETAPIEEVAEPFLRASVAFEQDKIDLPSFLAELEKPRATEAIEAEVPVVVAPEPAEVMAPEPMHVVALEPVEVIAPEPVEVMEPEPIARTDRNELWAAMSLAPHRWPRLDVVPEPRAIPPVPKAPVKQPEPVVAAARPEPVVVAARTEAAPGTEWLDMLAALRHDIERLRDQRTETPTATPIVRAQPAAPPTPVAAAAAAAAAPVAPPRKSKRAKDPAPAPIQDEWGFFDPQQCGFTALLAKLDEISNSGQ